MGYHQYQGTGENSGCQIDINHSAVRALTSDWCPNSFVMVVYEKIYKLSRNFLYKTWHHYKTIY